MACFLLFISNYSIYGTLRSIPMMSVIKVLNSKMIIFAKILFSLKTFIACNCITP